MKKICLIMLALAALVCSGAENKKTAEKLSVPICQEAIKKFSAKRFKIVLFGASNTERYASFMHWGDVLETSLRKKYYRRFHVINSGYSGSNTRDAKERFDWMVRDFKPDVVVITFGGNDSLNNPKRFIEEKEFAANLEFFVKEIRSWGGVPVLQTYYMPNLKVLDPVYAKNFVRYMQVVRDVAAKNKVFLVDQYKFFEKVDRTTHLYKLMLNAMHLNEQGNMLMGTILAKHFGLAPEKAPHNEKVLAAIRLFNKITGK
ncbi:MAG: hypothetical protein IKA87_01005 [Lentisphaeria bacterium]|nr:hypothetical protein [Lentisphaeria bacterium]